MIKKFSVVTLVLSMVFTISVAAASDSGKCESGRIVSSYDIDILARVIFLEGGSDYYEDEMLYYVGSVVLNRIEHELYPDTLVAVVTQRGQYESTEGYYWLSITPPDRCYDIAKDLLINGSVLPPNVVYQAQFEQGDGIYAVMNDTYFCYIDY